jgi:hypothetical protein
MFPVKPYRECIGAKAGQGTKSFICREGHAGIGRNWSRVGSGACEIVMMEESSRHWIIPDDGNGDLSIGPSA